jgi:hypothetical protein
MTGGSEKGNVVFETSVIIEQNEHTMEALSLAKNKPEIINKLFKLDEDIYRVKVEEKVVNMTKSEKTMNRLVNELDRLNVYSSSTQQI